MHQLTLQARFCMNYTAVHTKISKMIDIQLSLHGISFTEFMILFHLDQAIEKKMRRIDLAEKIGLSASGITRLVAPMEKIGLVHKESNKRDARVSLVKLSSAGKRIIQESTVSFNTTAQDILADLEESSISDMLNSLKILGGNI